MKTRKIILDTNVLFAGLYSSAGASYQVLRLIQNKTLKPVVSTTLLFEYEDILKRKQELLELTDPEIEIVLDNLCSYGEFQKVYYLWRPYLKDPKDDHVLELAVASQSDIIVTHNIKDFKGVDRFNIQAVTPKLILEKSK